MIVLFILGISSWLVCQWIWSGRISSPVLVWQLAALTAVAVLSGALINAARGLDNLRYAANQMQADRAAFEALLFDRQSELQSILDAMEECFFFLDERGRILDCNRAAEDVLGFTRMELVGRLASTVLVVPENSHGARTEWTPAGLLDGGRPKSARLEVMAFRTDGSEIPLEGSLTAVNLYGGRAFAAVFQDVTERNSTKRQLEHYAFRDPLTGLPNRAMLIDRLDHAIMRAERHPEFIFAVLFLDLDGFKLVNDSLGHVAGDKLLVEAAQRLLSCVRAVDTVARLGGDEFVILLDETSTADESLRVAERILDRFYTGFEIDGQQTFTTASIGITYATEKHKWAEDVLRDADIAMYQAKSNGKNRYELFSVEMHVRAQTRLRLESELRRALTYNEFRVYYQPIVRMESDRICGFEALVRWQHPERGLLAPGYFLDVAEDTDLIVPISWFVLREACMQLGRWQREIPGGEGLQMSVNLAANQIMEADFVDKVEKILVASGVRADFLTLEVTERTVLTKPEIVLDRLTKLKTLGVRLAIDDFGTGQSSLVQLRQLPFDGLKIDRSFVMGCDLGDHDDENWQIVKSSISLAHGLGMEVIGEGVETDGQKARLKALDCDSVQGYLFSRPVDQASASALLTAARLDQNLAETPAAVSNQDLSLAQQ